MGRTTRTHDEPAAVASFDVAPELADLDADPVAGTADRSPDGAGTADRSPDGDEAA